MDLEDAVRRHDWPAALELALARWRSHRTITAAAIVSSIARRLPPTTIDSEPIAELLARPDDPRVAMRLAAELVARPDDPMAASIVERIVALRYSLAIAKATTVARELPKPVHNMLALAGSDSPDATDDAARALLRTLDDRDGRIAELWRAVIAVPTDRDRRLVLADALIERGDPRGELIALQCQPEGHAESSRILEERRYEFLGDTALLVNPGSQFAGGLLASISVGTAITPPWVWEAPIDPRELCALHDVSPGFATAPRYAAFLAKLARMPRWVRVERAHIRELRTLGVACRFENVEFSLYPPPHDLARELVEIAAYAPSVVGFAIRVSHWPPLETCIAVARRVREQVPQLQRFLVALLPNHGNSEEAVEAATQLPFLEIVEAPSPPWLARWD